jgi:hypothetical protein
MSAPVAQFIVTAADFQHAAQDQALGQFAPGVGIQALHCGSGNAHHIGALRLIHVLMINQPDHFVFFEAHGH